MIKNSLKPIISKINNIIFYPNYLLLLVIIILSVVILLFNLSLVNYISNEIKYWSFILRSLPQSLSIIEVLLTESKEKINNSINILSDNNLNIEHKLLDIFFNNVTSIIKPVQVEGFFDDLVGQQIIIHIILFVLVISIIFLFIFFLISITIILNKDKILNKFNNKFIKYYIKYQLLLTKLSLIYVPILILIGLFTLAHGFYFLIKNQIPFDALGIDLHTFLSNKK